MKYHFDWKEIRYKSGDLIRYDLTVVFTTVSIARFENCWRLFYDNELWRGTPDFESVEQAKTYIEATIHCKLDLLTGGRSAL